jgi:hypothetical protein
MKQDAGMALFNNLGHQPGGERVPRLVPVPVRGI